MARFLVSIMSALAVVVFHGCNDSSGVARPTTSTPPAFEKRSVDGSGNNTAQPSLGSANVALLRLTTPDYGDGVSTPAGASRASARAVSNAAHVQSVTIANALNATDMFWLWGQFVDHDIDLSEGAEPEEPMPIAVPSGDPQFDPTSTGTQTIDFKRTVFVTGGGVRQQMNQITAFLDGSVVYGSDATRQAALRTNDGTGRLRVTTSAVGDLLPNNTGGLPNANTATNTTLFLGGDIRANENVLLTAMHTVWVREHNRLVDQYRQQYPSASGDELYELARRWVGAEIQAITVEEWLPLLLGSNALGAYGYDSSLQVGIFNEFSTACYRFGHTLLSPQLQRLDATNNVIAQGHLALRSAFFSPDRIRNEGGIEPLLRGAAQQVCQELDLCVTDEVRNFLFGAPGSGGFDLASLNIQRGRDHGLPSYNETRRQLGLQVRTSFAQVSSDASVQTALAAVYTTVADIDLWSGVLAEDHVSGAMVGELLREVLTRQFRLLRNGDRFWYENVFSGAELSELRATRLADVIRRNTTIGSELPANVFRR